MPDSQKHSIDIIGEPQECPAGIILPFASEVLAACGRGGVELAIAFVDDDEIQRLNLQFRKTDSPTDVLSFPIDDDTPEGKRYLGDVAVSLPTAARQAARQRHSLRRELLILIAHGIIHLCGHDHENDDGEMAALEQSLRQNLLPRYCEP